MLNLIKMNRLYFINGINSASANNLTGSIKSYYK